MQPEGINLEEACELWKRSRSVLEKVGFGLDVHPSTYRRRVWKSKEKARLAATGRLPCPSH